MTGAWIVYYATAADMAGTGGGQPVDTEVQGRDFRSAGTWVRKGDAPAKMRQRHHGSPR